MALPFRQTSQVRATIDAELRTLLPIEPDDLRIGHTVLERTPTGTTVLAAAVRDADLARLAAVAGAAASREVLLAPLAVWHVMTQAPRTAAVLIADGAHSALTVRCDGRLRGVRGLDTRPASAEAFVAEVRRTLAAMAPPDTPLVVCGPDALGATGAALARALAEGGPAPRVELTSAAPLLRDLSDPEAITVAVALALAEEDGPATLVLDGAARSATRTAPRRIAGWAAAAAILGLVDLGLYRHRLVAEDTALRAAIDATAAAALPGQRIVAPRAQLADALARRGAGGSAAMLDVLREITTRLPASVQVEIDALAIAPDHVRVQGRTPRYEDVDTLRRALETWALLTDVRTADTRTSVDGRTVEFTVHAARRAAPGSPS